MKALRIIVGIVGVLVALFAGGCGIFFLSVDPSRDMMWIAIPFGLVPAAIGVLVAWWAFKRRD